MVWSPLVFQGEPKPLTHFMVLSSGLGSLLAIARALIADPDILCIQQPVTLLHDEKAIAVLGVLRKFVEITQAARGARGSVPCGDHVTSLCQEVSV